MLIISVLVAIILVMGLGYLAPNLPAHELLGGNFYQVISIVLAIVISLFLNLPMLYMFSGNSAYKKGKYKDALVKYKKAYKTKRLSPDMEIFCGYIFLKEGDKAICEEVFDRVAKRKLSDRQKDSLDTNRALLLWKKGQIDDAVALLESVWERGESITVAGSLGALMLIQAKHKGDYKKALDFCEKTNEKFTYEKTIMANLGEAYYCIGDNDRALEVFSELMDCGSSAPAPFYYYGLALLKAGKKDEAEEMFNRSLRQRFSALSTVSRKTVKAKLEEITAE
ncbi:MAG: tetratricopeptide repeat protein [Clostridia bacterium]|nr:tetratricopeptide repeat protein [Clostridia bacterium]